MIMLAQKKTSIPSAIIKGFLFFLLNIVILYMASLFVIALSAYWSVKNPKVDEELGMFGVAIILFFCLIPVLSIICGVIEAVLARKIWGFNTIELIIFFAVTQLTFIWLMIAF